jgi:hypothetical protein
MFTQKNQHKLPPRQEWRINQRQINNEDERTREQQFDELPRFRSQSDWTPENIEIISHAIDIGIIKTYEELRHKIGNHSKKYIIKNGDLISTPASTMIDAKIGYLGKKKANINEHIFYKKFAPILKTIETKNDKNCYIDFDVPTEEDKIDALRRSNFYWRKKIYDYMMGEILYEHAMDKIHNISNEELIEQIETMIRLRNQENELFDKLKNKQNLTHDDAHIKAEKREINNLKQVQTYLIYKGASFNILIDEAEFYKKYLKYKNKYLTLKKLVEK